MATRPDPAVPGPDTIDPQSPAEVPVDPTPAETPMTEPDEVAPVGPDYDQPDRSPDELPS